MAYTARIWQLIGTFLPIYGVVLIGVAAYLLSGDRRVVALLLVPLLILWLCSAFGECIAYDGNILYVLLALFITWCCAFITPF